jgi:hopene-associated glycosyltransferase HpnB
LIVLAALTLLVWLYLLLLHGRFWSAGPTLEPVTPALVPEPHACPPPPDALGQGIGSTEGVHSLHGVGGPGKPGCDEYPDIDIVIPARNEAEGIEPVLRSLLAQDYPGRFHITLVNDNSVDDTAAIARGIGDDRLTVIDGAPRPEGWSGKLWAIAQGVAQGVTHTKSPIILLTDADIVHAPGHLSALVAKLQTGLDMVSEMVELRCASWAERALVPAFVFFFQLLYPFARVNDPRSKVAAAAGGTVLLRRDALERVGGIESLRGALIDDVTLATRLKPHGPIYLGHSALARSVRPYPGAADIWRMVARTAYVQLRFSPVILLGTILGLALVWLAPPLLTLFAHGPARWLAAAAWLGAMLSYLPTLRRFRQSALWALALPGIASFYMAATIGSAIDHHRGRGVQWKNRAYRGAGA